MKIFLELTIQEAFFNLFSSKMRSFLTLLGILIGTASVVALVSGGKIATQQVLNQFSDFNVNMLLVDISQNSQHGKNSSGNALSVPDAMNLKKLNPNITQIEAYSELYNNVYFHDQSLEAFYVIATTGYLDDVMGLKIKAPGRFISYFDRNANYCAVGHDVYQQISKYTDHPIGKQLQIGHHYFTIVGVLNSWKQSALIYSNFNKTVFIPASSAKLLNKDVKINHLLFLLAPKMATDPVKQDLTNYFTKYFPQLRLNFRDTKALLAKIKAQRRVMTMFLTVIAGISLVVGGIGVMNIMLVSVAERRQEIGIKMAIGAKRRYILSLFLIESIVLSLIGGLLGVVIGEGFSYAVARYEHWQYVFFAAPAIYGFLVSTCVGIFFGVYPAIKASKLDPIQGLRSE